MTIYEDVLSVLDDGEWHTVRDIADKIGKHKDNVDARLRLAIKYRDVEMGPMISIMTKDGIRKARVWRRI